MSHFAGLVIDAYDDIDGLTLRNIVPDYESIPDFVKEAQHVPSENPEVIPDDGFALVMLDQGHKLRKYATVDKGNTALSVLYLLKQAHLLPTKAVKVAAANLIEACERYDLDIPSQLKVAAETGVSGVSGESQDPYLKKELNKALERQLEYPVPEPPKESTTNPQLGNNDQSKDEDFKTRVNTQGVPGGNFHKVAPFSTKEKEKTAAADPETLALLNSPDVETKKKNWRTSPYVDVEGWEPGADVVKEASAPQRTLLRGKYPVDSYSQVKVAEAYFTEYTRHFHPRDRREYCTKLASRMKELSIPVPELIEKYASPGFGADVEAYVSFRRSFVPEEFHPALDALLEKQAHVHPETFAEALCEFDQMTNLNYQWDSQIPDPWESTFGPSLEKIAADEWVWDENGVRIDEEDLNNLALNGRELVIKKFGEDFAKQFAKEPKTFFNALPKPNQLVVARLAADRHSGTYTE